MPTGTLLPLLPCQNTSPVMSKSDPNARSVCIPDSPSLHLLGDHFEKAAAQPGCWDGESVVGSDRMPGSGKQRVSSLHLHSHFPTSPPPYPISSAYLSYCFPFKSDMCCRGSSGHLDLQFPAALPVRVLLVSVETSSFEEAVAGSAHRNCPRGMHVSLLARVDGEGMCSGAASDTVNLTFSRKRRGMKTKPQPQHLGPGSHHTIGHCSKCLQLWSQR